MDLDFSAAVHYWTYSCRKWISQASSPNASSFKKFLVPTNPFQAANHHDIIVVWPQRLLILRLLSPAIVKLLLLSVQLQALGGESWSLPLASKHDSSSENSLATARKKCMKIIPGCFGRKVMIIRGDAQGLLWWALYQLTECGSALTSR